ncbi:hypothetical protein D3C71_1033830 [compost metagenome]
MMIVDQFGDHKQCTYTELDHQLIEFIETRGYPLYDQIKSVAGGNSNSPENIM